MELPRRRKLALLVGCNYTNNHNVPEINKLHGCINDVNAMRDLIHQRFGFQLDNITILTDETRTPPTFSNIIAALNQMIEAAKPARTGDTLLFYFSGGGALVNPPVNPPVTNEIKKGIPAIISCDLFPITAERILHIIQPLPAIFTFICDSSYSGGLFDVNVQIEQNVPVPVTNFGLKTIPSNLLQPIEGVNLTAGTPPNKGMLFSSSKANEESVEVRLNGNQSNAFSAYSSAIQVFFNSPQAVNPPVGKTNGEVAAFTSASLGCLGFDQHPGLIPNENNAVALFLGGYVP